jgi:hypothetical protein
MNIAIRQAAIGAFVATALMLGASASPERGARSSVLPGWNIRVHEWVADGQIASATIAALAGTFRTCGAKALGIALDAVVEVAVRLR